MRLRDWFRGSRTPTESCPAQSAIETWTNLVARLLPVIADPARRERIGDLMTMAYQSVAAGDADAAHGRLSQIGCLLIGAAGEMATWRRIAGDVDLLAVAQRAVEEERAQPRAPTAEGIVARDLIRFGWWFPGDRIVITRFGPAAPPRLDKFRADLPEWIDRRDTPRFFPEE